MRVPVLPPQPPRAALRSLAGAEEPEPPRGWDRSIDTPEVDAFLAGLGFPERRAAPLGDSYSVSSLALEFDSEWGVRWDPPQDTGERDALGHVPGVTPPLPSNRSHEDEQ